MQRGTTRNPVAAPVIAVLLLVALSACVEETGPDPEACAAPSVTIELSLTADVLDPAAISVCRDQDVTLRIVSDVEGVIHIHGYDAEVPATQLKTVGETRLDFTASRSGQFPMELHPQEDPTGIPVGVFTVHEP